MITATPITQVARSETAPPTTNRSDISKDMFLQLMVTQLRHQNPTSPADPQAFIGQLAQFTELENSLATKDLLEEIRDLLQAQTTTSTDGEEN